MLQFRLLVNCSLQVVNTFSEGKPRHGELLNATTVLWPSSYSSVKSAPSLHIVHRRKTFSYLGSMVLREGSKLSPYLVCSPRSLMPAAWQRIGVDWGSWQHPWKFLYGLRMSPSREIGSLRSNVPLGLSHITSHVPMRVVCCFNGCDFCPCELLAF